MRPFVDQSQNPPVRGFLHHPEGPNAGGLVLTHGAGFNAQSPLLIAIAESFCVAGFTVLRCDLPFRQGRRFGPPESSNAARDRAGINNAVTVIRKLAPSRIFLGGHSYGGRQSSILCSENPDLASGLLMLSYPLHPPNKPDQLRIQHLPKLGTPTLFVHGSRDPFASTDELLHAIKLIPARTKLLTVEGAGHDLGFKGKTRQDDLLGEILKDFQLFFA
jgi:uncharacterized protein